jgi:DNA segregation ATPase FtsK/SpoIIIE, S-DNA-T family
MASSRRAGPGDVVVLAAVALATATAVVAAALLAGAGWLAARHPFCVAAMGVTTVAYCVGGPVAVLVLCSGMAASGAAWRARYRASYDRQVVSRWRRTFVYGWRWRRAMISCDLDRAGRWWRNVPTLGNVRSTRWIDVVSVHPLAGQDGRCFVVRSVELARAFGAAGCRARSDATGVVRLELRRGDPLMGIVPAAPIAARPDLDALPIGVCEDGSPWTISVARGHVLVAGDAGSGKGSVVWSLIRALAFPVHDGAVELWGIDGTGGMGLRVGEAMFARFAWDDPQAGVAILDDAAAVLRERAGQRRGPCGHAPSRGESFIVFVLDEIARWAVQLDDREPRRLAQSMELLLAHGCGAGIIVVATVPSAHPAIAPLFPQRVALRLAEAHHVCLMLGAGGHAVGADCEQTTRHLPGVGFAITGRDDPVRVRAAWVSDDEITAMSERFGAPAASTPHPISQLYCPV